MRNTQRSPHCHFLCKNISFLLRCPGCCASSWKPMLSHSQWQHTMKGGQVPRSAGLFYTPCQLLTAVKTAWPSLARPQSVRKGLRDAVPARTEITSSNTSILITRYIISSASEHTWPSVLPQENIKITRAVCSICTCSSCGLRLCMCSINHVWQTTP